MDRTDKLIISGCVGLTIGLVAALLALIKDFDKECHEAGGHVVSHTNNSIGFTVNGQMTFTPNVDIHCYSQDGRLLLE